MFRYVFFLALIFLFPFIGQSQVKVGEQAPHIEITSWIKNVPEIKDLKNKFIVIDFWATWCAPCLETVPHINNLVAKNISNKNLVFLAMTDEKEEKVNWLLKRVQFSAAVVTDVSRQTFDDFNVKFIPLCVMIDDTGIVRWVGNPGELSNEIIQGIREEKPVPLSPEKKTLMVAKEVDELYASLTTKYATYINDKDLKEYFSMTLSMFSRNPSSFLNKSNSSYNEMIISNGLPHSLAALFDVSESQIILPEKFSKTYISYCYKSEKKTAAKQVSNVILDELNLKPVVTDSLIEVFQFEVSDQELLRKFAPSGLSTAQVGHSSWSKSYIGIDHEKFDKLVKLVEDKFQKPVFLKQNNIFEDKMSITVKVEHEEDLIQSLASYGIKAIVVKKKMPVYHFKERN
ncbi:TlpA disulfide reductase family protein [Pedobacter psychrodurus]|jgi:thiol-disulfide isomerase/thioredoxin|uniref:TlpA family protein disulfide reductase n=1 Tax=Pedobacter psychrodurus TaxID=2530456 RepID=UPI00292DDF55|nr:TlpA disulfide reductase family protein [Pedobacter psychrodurus]